MLPDHYRKTLYILGSRASEPEKKVVLILERRSIPQEEAPAVASRLRDLQDIDSNDVYTWMMASYNSAVSDTQITIICPATETHIAKYSAKKYRTINETPAMYKDVVQPWINSIPADRINWVYNILDGVAEQDSLIFNDEDEELGYVMLPDR